MPQRFGPGHARKKATSAGPDLYRHCTCNRRTARASSSSSGVSPVSLQRRWAPSAAPKNPPAAPHGALRGTQSTTSPLPVAVRAALQVPFAVARHHLHLLFETAGPRPTTTKWGCAESLPFSQASSHTAYPPPKRPGSRTCLGSSSRTVYEFLDSFSS